MKILAIHDGHTATACLLENGKILGMASEERFTRSKSQGGFPLHAVKWLLSEFDMEPGQLDHIVFPGFLPPIQEVNAHNRHRHNRISKASKYIPDKILTSQKLTEFFIQTEKQKRASFENYGAEFTALGLDKAKASLVEHHICHAATAYYLDWDFCPDKKKLVLTLDGSGDGLCGSVSVGYKKRIERLKSIHSYNSLGMLYSRTTALLGMKPLEHEYKLMGMAPYASAKLTEKAYNVFKTYIRLDDSGLSFRNTSGVYGNRMIRKLQKDLFLVRFDGIAAGLQKITEELAVQWILNWVRETGIMF